MFQLILQLHITGQCNLRCKHCYISEHTQELSIDTIKKILHQLSDLVNELEAIKSKQFPVSIHITGGEPFYHSEIHTILDMLFELQNKYHVGIMSNGTMLDDDNLKKLSKLNLKAFQLSLDGCCETHDKIRGKGNYLSVLRALDLLYQYGIPSRVSFTANKENYVEFPLVADICRRHHVKSLWSDRIIPFEKKSIIKPIDNESDMKKYVEILANEKNNEQNQLFGLRIDNHRALQFIGTDDSPYWCTAGEQLITVNEYGNIMPCRRMPIVCGSIYETTLKEAYFNNSIFKRLREHCTSGKCEKCSYQNQCKGGAHCMSYAVDNSFELPDPCCFI